MHHTSLQKPFYNTQNARTGRKVNPLFISLISALMLLLKSLKHEDPDTGFKMGFIALALITLTASNILTQPRR